MNFLIGNGQMLIDPIKNQKVPIILENQFILLMRQKTGFFHSLTLYITK